MRARAVPVRRASLSSARRKKFAKSRCSCAKPAPPVAAAPVQRAADAQLRSERARRVGHTADSFSVGGQAPASKTPSANRGLPPKLRAGIESLSGLAMDDVRVHRNSTKPAELNAQAYTQGTDIHVGPGQEKHLAHEAWHVVQQKQGRVRPTMRMKGKGINDSGGLEREADAMGERVRGPGTQNRSRDPAAAHSRACACPSCRGGTPEAEGGGRGSAPPSEGAAHGSQTIQLCARCRDPTCTNPWSCKHGGKPPAAPAAVSPAETEESMRTAPKPSYASVATSSSDTSAAGSKREAPPEVAPSPTPVSAASLLAFGNPYAAAFDPSLPAASPAGGSRLGPSASTSASRAPAPPRRSGSGASGSHPPAHSPRASRRLAPPSRVEGGLGITYPHGFGSELDFRHHTRVIAEQDRGAEVFVRGSAVTGRSSKGGGFRSGGETFANSDIDVGVVSSELLGFPSERSNYGRAERLAAADMRPRGHHMGVKGFRQVPSGEPVIRRPHTPPSERRKPPDVQSPRFDARIEKERKTRNYDKYLEARRREEEEGKGK